MKCELEKEKEEGEKDKIFQILLYKYDRNLQSYAVTRNRISLLKILLARLILFSAYYTLLYPRMRY